MAEQHDELLVTEQGFKELKDRLEYLKTVKRYEVAERIKVARGYGDLSENAEYDEAKTEQGFIEGEINDLEAKLKKVKVIADEDIHTDEVSVGSIVKVFDKEFNEEAEYKIVGMQEADVAEGKLSNVSPVGQGLMGHKVGETVTIRVPNGTVEYEILSIRR